MLIARFPVVAGGGSKQPYPEHPRHDMPRVADEEVRRGKSNSKADALGIHGEPQQILARKTTNRLVSIRKGPVC
jgi:hypothetical protein